MNPDNSDVGYQTYVVRDVEPRDLGTIEAETGSGLKWHGVGFLYSEATYRIREEVDLEAVEPGEPLARVWVDVDAQEWEIEFLQAALEAGVVEVSESSSTGGFLERVASLLGFEGDDEGSR